MPMGTGSVDLGTSHLGAQHGLVEVELAVELLDGVRLGRERDNGVDALGVLGDLVGEPATSPDVHGLDVAAVLADDVEVLVERRLDGPLFEARLEDDHHFVGTHSVLPPLDSATTVSPWQEGVGSTARRRRFGYADLVGRRVPVGTPKANSGGPARDNRRGPARGSVGTAPY